MATYKMAASKMAVSKMASIVVLRPSTTLFSVVTLDQPLYSKAKKIILDSPPGSHLEYIVLVVGEIHTPVNFRLSDCYIDGRHITKLAF